MNSERVRVGIGLVIVSIVWGSTWLAIKIGLGSVPPFLGAGVRFVLAASIFFAMIRVRRIAIPWTPEARKVYGILGLMSFGIPYALVYWSEQFIPSGLTSILFSAYPLCVAIFSHVFLSTERLDSYKISGIAAGVVGLVVIFHNDVHLTDSGALYGMAAVLVSTVFQGFSLVMVKKHGHGLNPLVMSFVGMSTGAAILLVLAAVFESGRSATWDVSSVGSTLYLAVVGSVLAFGTYYWLLKRVEAVYLSLTSFINPIVAVLLGALVLGESLPPDVLGGAALVLIGLLLTNGRDLSARFRKRA